MKFNNLRIGTCSWKYNSWEGIIYPIDKEYDALVEYSSNFNTVEIDQWFWSLHSKESISLPKEKDVIAYTKSVPSDFRFSIKVPNSVTLTHFYQKAKTEPFMANPSFLSADLYSQFLKCLEPMKENLGPLMMQFEYLNKQKMPSQSVFMDLISEFVARIPAEYEHAIEIRNPNYLNDRIFGLFAECKLIPVFLQGYYMPPVFPLLRKYASLFEKIVIRLHGPDRSGIEQKAGNKWNAILEPKDSELEELAELLPTILERGTEVYLNVNNHYEGSAPLTIQRISAKLG